MTVLAAMKVPALFIGWIRECVTTARFSISINGGWLVSSREHER